MNFTSNMWNDEHRRLYEHLQARRAGNPADTSLNTTADTSEKEVPANDAADGGSSKENIYETLLGRIHDTLEQLHIQNEETANQSSAVIDPTPTTSGTSSQSVHSPSTDFLAVPPPPINLTKSSSKEKSRSKNKKSTVARRYYAAGTKADRLRSYLKYWPKLPSPSPGSSTSSPKSSSPRSVGTHATPEPSPEVEAEDNLAED